MDDLLKAIGIYVSQFTKAEQCRIYWVFGFCDWFL